MFSFSSQEFAWITLSNLTQRKSAGAMTTAGFKCGARARLGIHLLTLVCVSISNVEM